MKQYLNKIIKGEDLSELEMVEVAQLIFSGKASDIEIAGFLSALASKGESEDEIFAMVKVMRENMVEVEGGDYLLDTCGTGGDGANTFNVSTIVALICAAAGVPVAKHGNRSVSSKCGSFDVLEKLGLRIDLSPEQAKQCLDSVGITCLYAPSYHPAMKQVGQVRKELGIRTIFNFLGPMLNPAGAGHQLIGVSSKELAKKLGRILLRFGSKKVLIVHGDDGLDEASIVVPTQVYEFVLGEKMVSYKIEPEKYFNLSEVLGGGVEKNAEIMKNILLGKGTPAQNEFVVLNTGLAFMAAGRVDSFEPGKQLALELIKSGAGMRKLNELIEFSKSL